MRLAPFLKLVICLVLIFHLPTFASQDNSGKSTQEEKPAQEKLDKQAREKEERAAKAAKELQDKQDKLDKQAQEKEEKAAKAAKERQDKVERQTQEKWAKENKRQEDKEAKQAGTPKNSKANLPQDNSDRTLPNTRAERPTNPLVNQIELAITLNQFIEPPGKNAWELYQILAKNYPNDPEVKQLGDSLNLAMGDIAKKPLESYSQGANVIFTRNDWATAQEYSKRLKELQPKNKNYVLLDLFYSGMIALSDKQLEKAEELFRQGTKKDDKAAYFYNALGRTLSERHKDEESLKAYIKATELAPQWTFPLVNVALKYLRRGELEQARRFALSALNINSTDAEAHSVLGSIYSIVGNYDEAIKEYEIVTGQRPNSVNDWVAYGRLMLDQGNLILADKAFGTALQLNPMDQRARLYRSITAQRYTELVFTDATKQLEDSALTNNTSQTQIALADAAAYKNNIQKAIEGYQAVLKLEPWQVNVRLKLANLLADSGKTTEAIEEYRAATKANPALKEVYNTIGNLLKKNGDTKAAILEYRNAISADPNFISAHSNLALALQETGDLSAAAAEYRAVLSINANNPIATEALKTIDAKLQQQQQQQQTTTEQPVNKTP